MLCKVSFHLTDTNGQITAACSLCHKTERMYCRTGVGRLVSSLSAPTISLIYAVVVVFAAAVPWTLEWRKGTQEIKRSLICRNLRLRQRTDLYSPLTNRDILLNLALLITVKYLSVYLAFSCFTVPILDHFCAENGLKNHSMQEHAQKSRTLWWLSMRITVK